MTLPGLRLIDISAPDQLEYIQKSEPHWIRPPDAVKSMVVQILTFAFHTLAIPYRSRPLCLDLSANFSNYVKGRFFGDIVADVLGKGIFAVDGAEWHTSRKTISHVFTNDSFNGVISHSVETALERLISILTYRAKEGIEFDLQALFFAFTLSSFVQIGCVGCVASTPRRV